VAAPRSVVLATRNAHKVREFNRLLAPAQITVEPLGDDVVLPPEDGETFAANALPKARAAAAATGRIAIGDDSGIEAAALDGAPGVRSARFAGVDGEAADDEANLAKLLALAPAGSGLRYVCALAWIDPGADEADPEHAGEHVFEGVCEGTVAATPAGAGGFGYDPAFLPSGSRDGRTMAQLSDAEKDAISHRGNAVRALLEWLDVR
jgi:XTP/dITP diphosphohydrolase